MATPSVTVTANKFDPNTQSFGGTSKVVASNVAQIQTPTLSTPQNMTAPAVQKGVPTADQNLAVFNQSMVKGGTITSDSLKSPTIVPLVSPVDNTNDLITQGNKALADITTQAKIAEQDYQNKLAEGKKTSSEYSNMQLLLGNRGQDTMDTYNTKDSTGESLNDIYKQIAGYKARAENLELDKSKAYLQTQQESIGTGRTDAGIAPLDAAKQRSIAIEKLSLAQDTNIATAKYDAAKNYADQIINAKYDKLDAEIKAKQTNLQALKDFDLSPAQEKARLAREERLNAEKQVNEDKRTTEKQLADMLITASSQGAPSTLLAKAEKELDPARRSMILGEYSGDYYKTQLLKQQIATEKAQRAKIYSDIAANGATGAGGAVLGVEGISPLKFKDAQARTDFTKAGAVVEAIKSTLSGAQKDEKGNYYGLGYGGGNKPEVFLDQAGQTNRAFLSGINLKTQQWASGASLTKEQIDMVNKMVPQNTDADSTITRKLNALQAYMENEQKAIARTQGQSVIKQPEPNVFTQALKQPASKYEGTSIINNISKTGIDFALPTTTNVKVK